MSKYSLWKILENEELVMKNSTCTNILHKGMDYFLFPDHFVGMLLKPRKCLTRYEHAVVLTGGHNDDKQSSGCKQTYGLSLSTNKWLVLHRMPCSPRSRHGAAVCGGQLYVLGGQSCQPMCCYNPKRNKWSCVASVQCDRYHCSVTTYQEELFIIGGEGHWCSIAKFDPKHDEWTHLADMTTPRAAHCAVAMVKGICVIAGHDDHTCHRSVEFYDPNIDQWSEMPNLVNARRFAAAAAISSEKILVVGGFSDMAFREIEASCEIFDPAVNQWSLLSNPVVPRAACGIVSFDNRVYVFGGEDTNLDQDSIYQDSVECYDIQNNTWQLFGTMPVRLSCLQASLVLLPKKLFDIDNTEGDISFCDGDSSGVDPDESSDNDDDDNGDVDDDNDNDDDDGNNDGDD